VHAYPVAFGHETDEVGVQVLGALGGVAQQ
jgi:hypothetical protein